jgi:hypothetical protein
VEAGEGEKVIHHDPCPEYRAILCAECGDEALVVHSSTPASSVDGRRQRCESCGTEGKVVLLDDEDVSLIKLEFRAT